MTTQPPTPENVKAINDKIGLALSKIDDAAIDSGLDLDWAEKERDAAAIEAFYLMRKCGLGIECVQPTGKSEPPRRTSVLPTIPSRDMTIPFGKYKDETLGRIIDEDPDYFSWLAETCDITNPNLAEAIEEIWSEQ